MKLAKKVAVFKTNRLSCVKQFLHVTRHMNKLTVQEINVTSLIINEYLNNKKNFRRENDLWKHVFDYDTKLKIREELKMGNPVFQNILTALRKKNVVKDNRVIPLFIPNIEPTDEGFELVFRYIFQENGQNGK